MQVTIVGGGFGGIKAAIELAKDDHIEITLISDKTDFQYYPTLYRTATGGHHSQSFVPLGQIFAEIDNVDVVIDSIEKIQPDAKTITGASGRTYKYGTLVLGLGSVTTYFGIKGLDAYSHGIKSAAEINALKHHLYVSMFEERDPDRDYCIIGGGPTGVELAAMLGGYVRRLQRRYDLPRRHAEVHLIEAAPRLLPRMSEQTSRAVHRRLKKLGVHVMVNQKVEQQTVDALVVNGKSIKSQTVIWTSGVACAPFYKANAEHFQFAPNGKIVVDEYMQAAPNIYVIGDNAATPYSGLAQMAIRDGKFVAKHLRRKRAGRKVKPYKGRLRTPSVVLPIGDKWAVFEWKAIRLHGRVASWIRGVADFIGYKDLMPMGMAIRTWLLQEELQDDYFPASKD